MTDVSTVALYTRIPRDIKTALDKLADETGLTVAQVASVVLARGLGITSQDTPENRVRNALERAEKQHEPGV